MAKHLPDHLRIDSMPTDPLADILNAFTVVGTELVRFESSIPFETRFDADERFTFGVVIAGSHNIWLDGEAASVRLAAGDCFLLTGGRAGRFFNVEGGREIDCSSYTGGSGGIMRVGTGSMNDIVVAGRLTLDKEGAAWLREALPPVIRLDAEVAAAKPAGAIIELLRSESEADAPGRRLVTSRLADVLLVQTIRAHLEDNPEATNWLAALTDRQIGRAIQRFHADVAADWTVASLAKAAGMSRSSFADRFRRRMGFSPLDYVTRWRMHRVRRELLETSLPFATIAYRNGYSSRTSCSHAFKQIFGYSPSELRAGQKLAISEVVGARQPLSGPSDDPFSL
ncbi:AraC family transcriptional regulator [Bradyrhizobium neotropicale]|uniref:AraC family transcriptional regulator n=1 Tax=Bradyrhizobium neotropicale TaxID=1497615 RepID=UPI001AD6F85C|nr:AraC family transcriptional regulator [Bradyrhizobium neotropicale]MBO4223858.1 helix-turn-helix domain-containing protein [Bradyrhizobium neotropicale]